MNAWFWSTVPTIVYLLIGLLAARLTAVYHYRHTVWPTKPIRGRDSYLDYTYENRLHDANFRYGWRLWGTFLGWPFMLAWLLVAHGYDTIGTALADWVQHPVTYRKTEAPRLERLAKEWEMKDTPEADDMARTYKERAASIRL